MSDDLIAAHRDVEALMPYLHLPIQSGSDRDPAGDEPPAQRRTIICRLVERIRAARPDIALSSDFIVGFPGESGCGFRGDHVVGAQGRLCASLLVQIQRAARHAGRGSAQTDSRRREGCPPAGAASAARRAAGRIQRGVRGARHSPSCSRNRAARKARRSAARPICSPSMWRARASLIGQIADVRIEEVLPNSLKGALADREKVLVH